MVEKAQLKKGVTRELSFCPSLQTKTKPLFLSFPLKLYPVFMFFASSFVPHLAHKKIYKSTLSCCLVAHSEKAMAPHSSTLAWKIPWAEEPGRLHDFPFTFHIHALEKEMATPSSVLAWRIPGTGEPAGLPSVGSHRVGHDCSGVAAAAAVAH